MGLSVHVRYEVEEVLSTAGPRWLVWRSVDGRTPARCGAGRGLHVSRRDADDTLDAQRRADRAAGTRLGVEIVEVAPPTKPVRHKVSVRRDTRWDVYPQREPVETYEVICRPRRPDESEGQFAGRIADALAEQHPKWRVASPILVEIMEVRP